MEYASGLLYDQYTFTEQAEKSSEAFKFGSATGCTKGTFVIQGSCVRTMEYHDSLMDFGLPLFKQYEVQSLVNQEIEQFAAPGDSGALVFAKHDGKRTDLRVVGMVEGRTNHNTCVVTPIKAIFDNLDIIDRRFKVFRQHAFGPEIPISSPDNYLRDARIHNQQIEQNLLQELSKRESGLKQEQKESERRLTNTIETIERKVDTQIEQNLELSKRLRRFRNKFKSCLYDCSGFHTFKDVGLDTGYIEKLVKGNVPLGYKFKDRYSPDDEDLIKEPKIENKIHCVIFVIDAEALNGGFPKELYKQMTDVRTILHENEVNMLMVLTKIEKICKEVSNDLRKTFKSTKVREMVKTASEKFDLQLNRIHPIKNYESEMEINSYVDTLLLLPVRQALDFAVDYIKCEKDNEQRTDNQRNPK